jgi:MerR family transcriptional regulator, thiopeptide resistance regulator
VPRTGASTEEAAVHADRTYRVGEVARLAGVSVRTLHHYDEVRLLIPSRRTDAGYRTYTDEDLERLQRILVYRELELPLEDIAALLDGDGDPLEHLRLQHEALTARRDRIDELLRALEHTMEARQMGIDLTPEERFEVFGGFDPGEHDAEVAERWGDTDAYRESARRTGRYSKDDWQQLRAESDELTARFVAALAAGEPADGTLAMDLAEEARQQIVRWFYPLPHEGHQALADMYLADPRFTATYEAQAEGMARFVHDAIHANAARHAAG